MNEEFYIGQVFDGKYPPMAAVWCNRNNAFIDVIGEKQYEIKAVPEPPAPTHEDIRKLREQAYVAEVDGLHAQKMRHQILEDWTEEDEASYRANIIRLSQEIEERYPYPEE